MTSTPTSSRSGQGRPRMDRRMRNRRQQVARERMLRRRSITASLVGLVVVVALGVAVSNSRLFDVTSVRVFGAREAQAAQVAEAVGVRVGDPLLEVDVDGVEARVRRLPWVREVVVRRVPPAAVHVEVVPRVPVAAVRLPGATWLLDGEGVVLARAGDEATDPPAGTVVIEAPNSALPEPGQPATDPAVLNVLAVHRELPAAVRAAVERYEAPSDRDARALADVRRLGRDDPRLPPVVWARIGTAERIQDKARVLSLLLDRLPQQSSTDYALDLRVPDAPVLAEPEG